MCGVPYHSVEQYISRLVEKGYKIAICEQVEDPKQVKGVVKREVVKLITPGTVMDGKMIREKENNYLSTVTQFEDGSFGIARTDLSTGENAVTLVGGDMQEVTHEVAASNSKEVVLSPEQTELAHTLQDALSVTLSYEEDTNLAAPYLELCSELEQHKLKITFARLVNYLVRTQKRSLDHLQKVYYYSPDSFFENGSSFKTKSRADGNAAGETEAGLIVGSRR